MINPRFKSFTKTTTVGYDKKHTYDRLMPDVLKFLKKHKIKDFQVTRHEKRNRDAGFVHSIVEEIDIIFDVKTN